MSIHTVRTSSVLTRLPADFLAADTERTHGIVTMKSLLSSLHGSVVAES